MKEAMKFFCKDFLVLCRNAEITSDMTLMSLGLVLVAPIGLFQSKLLSIYVNLKITVTLQEEEKRVVTVLSPGSFT